MLWKILRRDEKFSSWFSILYGNEILSERKNFAKEKKLFLRED